MNCRHCGVEMPGARKDKIFCTKVCYWTACRNARAIASLSPVKRCSKCKEEKSRDDFSPQNPAKGDGRHGWCKPCRTSDEARRRLSVVAVERHRGRYQDDLAYRAREMIKAIGKRAKRQGFDFDLTTEWLEERLRVGLCEISGVDLDLKHRRRPGARTPSVDRIVAGGGYTKENCRVIAMSLNWAISNWGVDEFLPIAEALVARSKRKMAA